ncbi:MAG: cell surface protein SprA, partial [Ignavibacteria bacterium]|nr:cell surface protein SprA [Ignavibacteria bacterium]
FEGAKKIVSLGGIYNTWRIASIPLDNSITICDSCVSLYSKSKRRGKFKWFDITNSEPVTNIYPLKSIQSTQANVTPLNIVYTPARRGTYNYNGSYESIADKSTTWNGIMKYLNTSSNDLLNENINFIEFSMQIFKGDSAGVGKLVIDLGNVSQDVIPNDIVDTEDTLRSGNLQSINDDLGMDFLNDEGEKNLWRALNPGIDPPDDPALDNFKSTTNDPDYDAINGTQGNANSDAGRKPDTEDLNKTNNVRNGNDYFQYEVNLDIVDNPYVVGVGKEGWRQYKIPLSEFRKKYGSAVFTNIQFVRLWVTGVNDSVSLKLYEINLTGNQWVKQIKT